MVTQKCDTIKYVTKMDMIKKRGLHLLLMKVANFFIFAQIYTHDQTQKIST
jgi:hypothetical protein